MAGRWLKAHEINDWGSIVTVLGTIHKSSWGTYSSVSHGNDRLPRLIPEMWKIRWPSGDTEVVSIVAKQHSEEEFEQGDRFPHAVYSKKMYIVYILHGVEAEILAADSMIDFWVETKD